MKLFLLFLSGLFLANGVPHFINGISGRRFHSPFAIPFVTGSSSAWSNVAWGIFNFLVGTLLFQCAGGVVFGLNPAAIALASGFVLTSLGLALFFERLDESK